MHLGGGAHALAIQILGNPDDAADAVHDSLARALERPDSYDASKGPVKPWFLRMVRNRCIDLLRKRKPTDDRINEIPDRAHCTIVTSTANCCGRHSRLFAVVDSSGLHGARNRG